MNLKLPRFYQLALALAAVIGPFFWLVFTPDGQRRSDLFLLYLLGRPSFDLAYERLTDAVTEAMLRAQFPKVQFQCQTAPTNGLRLCAAPIAAFNGLPARAARLYFAGEHLRMLQLDYRPRYRAVLERSLRAGLGAPREETTAAEPVLVWQRPGGQILLPAVATANERDAALIWLAGNAE